jgi:hypothetical protein
MWVPDFEAKKIQTFFASMKLFKFLLTFFSVHEGIFKFLRILRCSLQQRFWISLQPTALVLNHRRLGRIIKKFSLLLQKYKIKFLQKLRLVILNPRCTYKENSKATNSFTFRTLNACCLG